jgi:YVTN family beta-propeller protein
VHVKGVEWLVSYDSQVSVINTATNTVTATIDVGVYPDGVAVSPDGTHLADGRHAGIAGRGQDPEPGDERRVSPSRRYCMHSTAPRADQNEFHSHR